MTLPTGQAVSLPPSNPIPKLNSVAVKYFHVMLPPLHSLCVYVCVCVQISLFAPLTSVKWPGCVRSSLKLVVMDRKGEAVNAVDSSIHLLKPRPLTSLNIEDRGDDQYEHNFIRLTLGLLILWQNPSAHSCHLCVCLLRFSVKI